MKIISLSDNVACAPEFEAAHGASLYVESGSDRLLIDAGGGPQTVRNADRLNADLSAVTAVIVSHGHGDHGGGLAAFFERNRTAKVYIRSAAFGRFYSRAQEPPAYIGLDPSLAVDPRVVADAEQINGRIRFLLAPEGKDLWPSFNGALWAEKGGKLVPDDFAHEQSVLVTEDGKAPGESASETVLFAPCSHRGIVNILESAACVLGKAPALCVAGFHTYNPSGAIESDDYLRSLADRLSRYDTRFYACHCTGFAAYEKLKVFMGDRIAYLAAGQSVLTER
ncbi:MBL fold hydrolase [Clostridia bacterium]|nr:MBL fold hydrolase [Clostridia bacterium]